MTLEEVKQEISLKTGVPASLLTGETVEEDIALAKALLAYKREHEAQEPKSTAQQFAEWTSAQFGEEPPADETTAALYEIEQAAKGPNYPTVTDGGEVEHAGSQGTTKEQFEQWFYERSALDPRKIQSILL